MPRPCGFASIAAPTLLAWLAAAGCASAPVPRALCGTWTAGELQERWWLDGRALRGQGSQRDGGVAVTTEALTLRPGRGRSVYVAAPAGQAPTEFRAIDPSEARFGPTTVSEDSPGVWHGVWANYDHDFPQEIHYILTAEQLRAVVGGPDGETGWTFTRTAPCSEPPP